MLLAGTPSERPPVPHHRRRSDVAGGATTGVTDRRWTVAVTRSALAVAGVAPEVLQGGDGPVGRRVAEPAGLPGRRRARGWPGRSPPARWPPAPACRCSPTPRPPPSAKRRSWRSWNATIAFQPVVGVEGPVAQQAGAVRLDAETEEDHGVDRRVRRHQLQHLGDGVAALTPGHVDGVGPAPPRRELRVDGVPQVVGQRHELQRRARPGRRRS